MVYKCILFVVIFRPGLINNKKALYFSIGLLIANRFFWIQEKNQFAVARKIFPLDIQEEYPLYCTYANNSREWMFHQYTYKLLCLLLLATGLPLFRYYLLHWWLSSCFFSVPLLILSFFRLLKLESICQWTTKLISLLPIINIHNYLIIVKRKVNYFIYLTYCYY